MNAASAYGRGRWLQGQLIYSSFALQVHNQAPAGLDFDALWNADTEKFSPFKTVEGAHNFAAFTHICGVCLELLHLRSGQGDCDRLLLAV